MNTMLTLFPIWTKAGKIELAQLPPNVPLSASWALLAKSAVIVFAQRQLRIFLDMDVQTFITVLAIPVLVEELTFAHLPQIILVEVIARIALFAETFKPVLADIVVVVTAIVVLRGLVACRMAIGTATSARTMAIGSVVGAYGHGRSKGS